MAQALSTDSVDPTELAAELQSMADSLNQAIQFIRSLATAQQTFRPVQVSATRFVIDDRHVATAAQTTFIYSGGLTIDAATATVAVFVDGVRLDPDDVAVAATQVVIPAQTLGAVVVLEIHENADSVFLRLAQTIANEGASLIGIEDVGGLYTASTVEDALQEVRAALATFVALVGDLSEYDKLDGSRPWTGEHDAGGEKLTNLADGTDPTDAVTLGQIQSVLSVLGNLSGFYLALSGGVMAGHINMAGLYRVVGLAAPVAGGDAANKAYVDSVLTTGAAGKVDLDGTKGTSDAGGLLSGPISFQQLASATADADQTTDPDTVTVHTIHGVAKPGANDHVANKQYVDEAIGSAGVFNREIVFYRDAADGNTTGVTPTGSGGYTFAVPADVVGGILEIECVGGGGGGGGGAGNGSGHSGFVGSAGGNSSVYDAATPVAEAVGGPGGTGGPDNDTAAAAPAAPNPASCTGDTKIAPSGAAGSASVAGGGTASGGAGGRLILPPGYVPPAAAGGGTALGGEGAPPVFGWGGAGGGGEDVGESGGAGGSSSIYVRKLATSLASVSLTVQVGNGGTGGVGGGTGGAAGVANARVGGTAGGTDVGNGAGGGGGSPGFVRIRFRQP